MNASDRRRRLRAVLVFALVYLVVGAATASLAGSASSNQMRTGWRLAAWALSFVAFGSQILYQRQSLRTSAFETALHTAAAVALGAFALAAAGPVRTHWGATDQWRVAVLSLVLWPIVTGVPAFLVAFGAGAMLGRHAPPAHPTP